MTQLDKALLGGADAVIAHYEPVVAAMARKRATQERATLNEPDLQQLGRMTVLRCYQALGRMTDVKSFDGLVKDAVCKRLLTEKGKEFCVSRGRFLIEEFKEVLEEGDETSTPPHAQTAYKRYNDALHSDFTMRTLVNDIYALVPDTYKPVLDVLLDKGDSEGSIKRLAAAANMSVAEFCAAVNNIRFILQGYGEELFSSKYRCI